MPKITAHVSMSLDGFIAGPDQTRDDPLGVGGEELHTWHMGQSDNDVDREMTARILSPRGAYVMGRNMFGPVRGEWADVDGQQWRGWWGEEPPYHCPVFVLSHYPQDPIEMAGGTTFHFVDGFDRALELAVEAAGEDTVTIAGGASAVRQGLERGVIDELLINHAPVTLGGGESIFDGLIVAPTPIEVKASPYATHVVYRFD
jgi:dihydrofolate reductase